MDLIQEQIRVAFGLPLSKTQEEIRFQGHAMECRINAEDPKKKFVPSPGKVSYLHVPGGKGIRIDTAMENEREILPYYDSMIIKLIVHESDRRRAIRKMQCALRELEIEGVETNKEFLEEILKEKDFCDGKITTGYLEEHFPDVL